MPSPLTPPNRSDWLRVKRWYEAALDIDPAQREAFLLAAELDPPLLAEVRSLLAHDPDRSGSQHAAFLNQPAMLALAAERPRTGERMGNWEIVRAIGAGGMGEVFEARRPHDRRWAQRPTSTAWVSCSTSC